VLSIEAFAPSILTDAYRSLAVDKEQKKISKITHHPPNQDFSPSPKVVGVLLSYGHTAAAQNRYRQVHGERE